MEIKKILFTSLMALSLPLTISAMPNNTVKKVNAYDNYFYIAIDSNDGIGYISTEVKDFYHSTCNFFTQIRFDKLEEKNIFDQVMAEQYLGDIKKVIVLDKVPIREPAYLFYNLPALEEIQNIGSLDTSGAIDFSYMFAECPNLKTVDFTGFDTSSSWSFRGMFKGTGFETLDLSSFETSDVGDFNEMFKSCNNLTNLDVSSFNTAKASDMRYMFDDCEALTILDISSFDLSNCPEVEQFFEDPEIDILYAPKVVPGSPFELNFNIHQYSMDIPYYYDEKLHNYASLKPANTSITYYSESVKTEVVYFSEAFLRTLNEDIEDMGIDTLMLRWENMSTFLDVYEATYKEYALKMLELCDETASIETAIECVNLYDNIYTKYYGALKSVGGDFLNRCPNAEDKDGYIHIGIDTTSQTGYLASYDTYEILTSDISWKVKIENSVIENSIFSTGSYLDYEDLKEVVVQDEIEIINASKLFKGLGSVESISNIDNLDTSSSTTYASMFENCSSLVSLDLTGLDSTNVVTTSKMFENCTSLITLDLFKNSTGDIQQIDEMFYGCSSLITIDLSKLDFSGVTVAINLLYGTSFFYLYTPDAMPTSASCNINLYVPQMMQNYYFYDTSFTTYTVLPKDRDSFLIISEFGKGILGDFCDDFCDECDRYCVSDGSTSKESLTKLWGDQASDFERHFVNTPHSCLLEFFKQDNTSCIYEPLYDFSCRYDYIYGKYSTLLDECGGDFASRSTLITFTKNNSVNFFSSNIDENSTIILIVISLLTITGISLIFLSKRKFR